MEERYRNGQGNLPRNELDPYLVSLGFKTGDTSGQQQQGRPPADTQGGEPEQLRTEGWKILQRALNLRTHQDLQRHLSQMDLSNDQITENLRDRKSVV